MLLEKIRSISGDRQADIKIQECLEEMHDLIVHGCDSVCDESVDDDELRAVLTDMNDEVERLDTELTEALAKNEKLEEENDNLRAVATEMDEADSELRAEVTEITDETEIDQGSN